MDHRAGAEQPITGAVLLRHDRISRLLGSRLRLQVLSAPTGYGKSTLGQQAAASAGGIYLRLDGKLDHVTESFERATGATGIFHDAAAAKGGAGIASALTALVTAKRTPIVVADFGPEPPEPRFAHYLVDAEEYFPLETKIVLCGQQLPQRLGLQRRLLEGTLGLWGPPELRFDRAEITALLEHAGYRPSETLVESVDAVTEGWPLGLRAVLSLLSSGGTALLASIERSERGALDPRILFDFLAAEVLARLDPEDADVLVRAGLLEHLDPVALEAVTGRSGAAVLAMLKERDLFLLDGPEGARFHRFFRRFLEGEAARRLGNVERETLHARAARALRAAGRPAAALGHLAACGDWADVEDLILKERAVRPDADPGRVAEALDGLPQERLAASPALIRLRFDVACRLGETEVVTRLQPLAARYVELADLAVRAHLERGETAEAVRLARTIAEIEQAQSARTADVRQAEALLRAGSVTAALEQLARHRIPGAVWPEDLRLLLARVDHAAGETGRALDTLRGRALRDGSVEAVLADALEIALHALRGEPPDLGGIEQCVDLLRRKGLRDRAYAEVLELAQTIAALGQATRAEEGYAGEMLMLARVSVAPAERARITSYLAARAAALGDHEAARALLGEVSPRDDEIAALHARLALLAISPGDDAAGLTAAYRERGAAPFAAAAGLAGARTPDEVRAALEEISARQMICGLPAAPFGIAAVVDAHFDGGVPAARYMRAFPEQTCAAIRERLEARGTARPGEIDLYVALGGPVEFLRAIAGRPDALGAEASRALSSASADYENLPTRQRMVLEMLVEGRTNKEMAHALGLSERTVANHVARLAERFNASSRAGIVAAALRRTDGRSDGGK